MFLPCFGKNSLSVQHENSSAISNSSLPSHHHFHQTDAFSFPPPKTDSKNVADLVKRRCEALSESSKFLFHRSYSMKKARNQFEINYGSFRYLNSSENRYLNPTDNKPVKKINPSLHQLGGEAEDPQSGTSCSLDFTLKKSLADVSDCASSSNITPLMSEKIGTWSDSCSPHVLHHFGTKATAVAAPRTTDSTIENDTECSSSVICSHSFNDHGTITTTARALNSVDIKSGNMNPDKGLDKFHEKQCQAISSPKSFENYNGDIENSEGLYLISSLLPSKNATPETSYVSPVPHSASLERQGDVQVSGLSGSLGKQASSKRVEKQTSQNNTIDFNSSFSDDFTSLLQDFSKEQGRFDMNKGTTSWKCAEKDITKEDAFHLETNIANNANESLTENVTRRKSKAGFHEVNLTKNISVEEEFEALNYKFAFPFETEEMRSMILQENTSSFTSLLSKVKQIAAEKGSESPSTTPSKQKSETNTESKKKIQDGKNEIKVNKHKKENKKIETKKKTSNQTNSFVNALRKRFKKVSKKGDSSQTINKTAKELTIGAQEDASKDQKDDNYLNEKSKLQNFQLETTISRSPLSSYEEPSESTSRSFALEKLELNTVTDTDQWTPKTSTESSFQEISPERLLPGSSKSEIQSQSSAPITNQDPNEATSSGYHKDKESSIALREQSYFPKVFTGTQQFGKGFTEKSALEKTSTVTYSFERIIADESQFKKPSTNVRPLETSIIDGGLSVTKPSTIDESSEKLQPKSSNDEFNDKTSIQSYVSTTEVLKEVEPKQESSPKAQSFGDDTTKDSTTEDGKSTTGTKITDDVSEIEVGYDPKRPSVSDFRHSKNGSDIAKKDEDQSRNSLKIIDHPDGKLTLKEQLEIKKYPCKLFSRAELEKLGLKKVKISKKQKSSIKKIQDELPAARRLRSTVKDNLIQLLRFQVAEGLVERECNGCFEETKRCCCCFDCGLCCHCVCSALCATDPLTQHQVLSLTEMNVLGRLGRCQRCDWPLCSQALLAFLTFNRTVNEDELLQQHMNQCWNDVIFLICNRGLRNKPEPNNEKKETEHVVKNRLPEKLIDDILRNLREDHLNDKQK